MHILAGYPRGSMVMVTPCRADVVRTTSVDATGLADAGCPSSAVPSQARMRLQPRTETAATSELDVFMVGSRRASPHMSCQGSMPAYSQEGRENAGLADGWRSW